MKNAEIADIFDRIADMLEFKGEMVFKVASYRRAARTLRDTPEDIAVVVAEKRLSELAGIGKSMAEKIEEYLRTGKIAKSEELCKGYSEEFIVMLQIPGMGPKSLAVIHSNLKISTIKELEAACLDGRLSQLPGLGAKKAENILKGIEFLRQSSKRIPLGIALPVAEQIVAAVRKFKAVERAEMAGSLRRMRDTIGDIDILASSAHPQDAIHAFTAMPEVKRVLAAGGTKASVIVEGNQQIDLRVVEEESYGSALLYFTGSKPHNVKLRDLAKGMGLKINEYGVFRGDRKIAGRDEEDVYDAAGLVWIPPELREDRGEIEAAMESKLPHLVTIEQIRGDLHVHSDFSDGSATLEQLARRAEDLGYEYLAVTDHSQSLKIAHGLTAERVEEKMARIRELNKKLKKMTLLLGTELDILSNGKLDYPDEVLEQFDWVVASIHSGFKQPGEKITQRIIAAMEHPLVDCIAHPTGRQIGRRAPYELDLEKVLQAAARTETAIEINANYDRLDLDDIWCRRAKKYGVKLAIGTDAHKLEHMSMIRLGVAVARRGWLEPQDVLNTLPLKKLRRKRPCLART
ncbi:MAG: DNA polymerase/3'-5' exonuclease PolX [Candidatus Abyssobacteria bacterium SURF_5]|uniref:DNA polymerase beta n=1 Tax=Abyssobacteria bacterium (strain SURF_5) TaxID=2093360 RepID=A0A3A4P217_ABYX5|nr:MAG: DNA polymerase/3'-5' exonuclease PolX [Candidatus Abyssubacteria bacterium SURF_5]